RALHGSAQPRTPAEQLLRTEAVTACNLRDDGALGQALGDDLRLLLSRPLAPPLRARDDLDPPQTRRHRHLLGVVTTVNIMVKTMAAHGPASCPWRTPRGTWGPATAYPRVGGRIGAIVQLCARLIARRIGSKTGMLMDGSRRVKVTL